ncbi:unnamed protein product [Rhodiola kirilowii]
MASSLSPTQRYASAALFALALNQAQIHQTRPLGSVHEEEPTDEQRLSSVSSGSDSVADDPELWVHECAGLLRPVFRFLEIDQAAWHGLEETAGSATAKSHVGPFLRLLAEDNDALSAEMIERETALAKAVDAMASSMESSPSASKSKQDKHHEYENQCREKFSTAKMQENTEAVDDVPVKSQEIDNCYVHKIGEAETSEPCRQLGNELVEEVTLLSYQKKVAILYELLSACLADLRDEDKKCTRKIKGYDARHRAALRLLTTWFDLKWIKMEAIETMVACSAMALKKEQEAKEEESQTPKSNWAKWKRGGIIGAAAITGGTLMAITGGLAAPAIAAGFGALAPTLGTIIPVIGASGFAAVASAAGTVAGSIAVAASFGAAGAGLSGTKMARRIGGVDEFEFKTVGENHNQGRLAVGISVSGFVFEEEDFVRPWEGIDDNLERYALQWESKNLIAVSTAIQDWLTSRLAMELMKQGAMMTVLSTLMMALAWPATILAATEFIDSKWTIAVNRSDKAGKLLAEVLVKGLQGNRPVTLIGNSLGARVIFKCLQHLAETQHNAEIVERVVLLGAPISISGENWAAARKVVSGRFVNAYSSNDWTLGLAFRASLLSQGLAGIQPVDVQGIENVDVTELIEGHSSYLWVSQHILDKLELDTYYPVFIDVADK